MSKGSIKEPNVRIKPSPRLTDFIKTLSDPSVELPENLLKVYRTVTDDNRERNVYKKEIPMATYTDEERKYMMQNEKSLSEEQLKSAIETLSQSTQDDASDQSDTETIPTESETKHVGKNRARRERVKQREKERSNVTLNLTDVKWLCMHLNELRKADESVKYLHEFIAESTIILPKNEIIPRNPELEARCQRLKREQDEKAYQAITKNVDCSRTHSPDETISYQCKCDLEKR